MPSDLYNLQSPIVQRLIKYSDEEEQEFKHVRDTPDGQSLPPPLTQEVLIKVLNVLFWASLGEEERRFTPLSVALCPARLCHQAFVFDIPAEFEPAKLSKVAPAVSSFELGIEQTPKGALQVWGFMGQSHLFSYIFRVIRPGAIAVKHHQQVLAVMSGHEDRFIGGDSLNIATLVANTFDKKLTFPERMRKAAVLLEIVKAMHNHHRGGTLLLVPSEHRDWERSVQQPAEYGLSQSAQNIAAQLEELLQAQEDKRGVEHALMMRQKVETPLYQIPLSLMRAGELGRSFDQLVRGVGDFTAVDGAKIVSEDFEVIGFGAKITADATPDKIATCIPCEGSKIEHCQLHELGGTRHQSAARFVCANHDALAFVSSQDGPLTMFGWALKENEVVAVRRLDWLLL